MRNMGNKGTEKETNSPQSDRILHQEMHPQRLPRRRFEQRRIRLPRPLRWQVLRRQH